MITRDNLDLQRALQIVAQATPTDEVSVVFAADEKTLPGYVAYEGQPVVPFRLTTDDWPEDDDIPDGEEVPTNCLVVFEPDRPGHVFRPLEEYLRVFDASEYRPALEGDDFMRLVLSGSD